MKVGTWNVASLSGTEKDIGGWFIDGKGLSETLSGLHVGSGVDRNDGDPVRTTVEDVGAQESRWTKKEPTIPKNDPGPLPGGDDIGIYALGLQEIVDVNSATEALRPFTDPHPAKKWKGALAKALPQGYQLVAEQQLIGLLLLIYASPTVAPAISSVSTTSVGTGVMGYMGNKGAVTARIVLGDTTRLVFINCHLAAGIEKGSVERRNWDASQIASRTRFTPIDHGGGIVDELGEGIGDEDFAFWFGDLNYRLDDLPGDDVRRLLMLHTRNEYDTEVLSKRKIEAELSKSTSFKKAIATDSDSRSSDVSSPSQVTANASPESLTSSMTPSTEQPDPSTNLASLQVTLNSLLPHDQLHKQMRIRKAFHDGWREGSIDFLPTYKYDAGSVAMFDSSDKKRGPSWCDRILYRTRKDKLDYDDKVAANAEAVKRDQEMKARGIDETSTVEDEVLFDYNPETDGTDDEFDEGHTTRGTSGTVKTGAGFEDKLQLNYYTPHQRVLSSDHKPLDAGFILTYEAVDPQLKSKIHQELTRELDKAENEGRPIITIVVDPYRSDENEHSNYDFEVTSADGVDFGHVRYDQAKHRSITIANTGQVPATFSMVEKSGQASNVGNITPPWLHIEFDRPNNRSVPKSDSPQAYTLDPGDTLNIGLTVRVTDMSQVSRLNDGHEGVDDVLVLRVHNGRDHFIPVRGTWLQSSFGRSLDKLRHIPEGSLRRLQHQRPDSSRIDEQAVRWSAPRQLFRLTEAIEELVERSLAEWSMKDLPEEPPWDEVGWPFTGASSSSESGPLGDYTFLAREALDSDQPFSSVWRGKANTWDQAKALGTTLVGLLKSLEDGVITSALWKDLEDGMLMRARSKTALSEEDERTWILDVLSVAPAHSVSFTILTFMLVRIASELASWNHTATPTRSAVVEPYSAGEQVMSLRHNKIDEAYAQIFAPACIRAALAEKSKEKKASDERRKRVVKLFIKSR